MNSLAWAAEVCALPSVEGEGKFGSRHPSLKAVQSILALGGLTPLLNPFEGQMGTPNRRFCGTSESLAQVSEWYSGGIQAAAVELLDQELARNLGNKRPLVLFSGGVDSSLLAARLKSLGRGDALLVHYQFRADDPETEVARRIAKQLNLELYVIQRRPDLETLCFDSPGRQYPIPFGDQSAGPTAELCNAVIERFDPSEVVIFDGTGADGAFGMGPKSQSHALRSAGIAPLLRVGSLGYKAITWRTSGRVEYVTRVSRRVSELGPAAGAVAQNSLFGILYEAPDLAEIVTDWKGAMTAWGAHSGVEQLVLSDLAITCARIFAQKTYGPFSSSRFEIRYPFLTGQLAALGIVHTNRDPRDPPKGWMKRQLAKQIDATLVYRPKSGFIDPHREIFDSPVFRGALDGALASDGVAHSLIRRGPIARFLARHRSLAGLPHGHQNLLWALAFLDRWYRTYPTSRSHRDDAERVDR